MTPDNAESRDLERDGEPPRPFHLESYEHLLKKFPHRVATGTESDDRAQGTPHAGAVIDAIIVPTIRLAEQLRPAIKLASQLRCQLIALYTDEFPADLSQTLASASPGQATAFALRSEAGHPLLDLASAMPQSKVSECALDISRKRNLGLLIGRSCRWTSMLFLDDDIRRLSAEKVRAAAALLSEYPVVGLQVTGFPDASVVGHVRRMAGSGRKPFISGGSMLVNPQRMRGFFPPVYHEDWLFIMDHLWHGEVAISGSVAQLPYELFTTKTKARAQLEEFGDILASGLLWLVHAKRDLTTSDQGYWREATKPQFWFEILQQRAILLNDLCKRLELIYRHHPKILPLESIRAAQKRCDQLSPDEFAQFMEKWLDSLAKWRTRLSSLPKTASVAKALAELGLLEVVTIYDERPSRVRTAARKIRNTVASKARPPR
jgi:hypothetical protein